MAVQGFGAGDFVALSKFAWKIYENVRESRANFGKLNIDVECLLVSVGSLDKGHTQDLIAQYIDQDEGDTCQQEVRALRDGLNSVIMPFYALFENNVSLFKNSDGAKTLRPVDKSVIYKYVDGPGTDPVPVKSRPWRRWAMGGWIDRLIVAFELKDLAELRARFAVQASNLNLFMTRLAHTQLQRQTELLTLNLAEQSLLRDNFRYSLELTEAKRDFRRDVARYVKFLIDGGQPLSESELRIRRANAQYSKPHGKSDKWRREREREHDYETMEYKRRLEDQSRQSADEVFLDDDARLKLAAARQRLALADIHDDHQPGSQHVTFDLGSSGSSSTSKPVKVRRTRRNFPRRESDTAVERVLSPRKPNEPRRRAASSSSTIVCDSCDDDIPPDKKFYRCESGKCGDSGDSFDICEECYEDGENCPGYDNGFCMKMDEVMWEEAD